MVVFRQFATSPGEGKSLGVLIKVSVPSLSTTEINVLARANGWRPQDMLTFQGNK